MIVVHTYGTIQLQYSASNNSQTFLNQL